uniref:WAP domain-containing protein n=1 Tax=Sinocyclocheilus grahami TaxID=75366 RepID=A0A672JZ84_SINGR
PCPKWNTSCALAVLRTYNDHRVRASVKTARPGECPPLSSVRRLCTWSCTSDFNCPNNEKCCSNGCGRYCTAPYTVKPNQCPNPKNIPLSAESCFNDGQCPATQKCCPTTSGHACSEPS